MLVHLIYTTYFGYFSHSSGEVFQNVYNEDGPKVAKSGEDIKRYSTAYFMYSFCVLVVSFKKRVTVPGVRAFYHRRPGSMPG